MFSIRQNTFQRSTRLPKKSQLLTMDVIYKGQPFVDVVATNGDSYSLDIIKQAKPFVPAFNNTKKSSQLTLSGTNHPDVQLWLNNVTQNGGTASSGTISALNTFCNSIDSAGLRSKFYRLNLFCGNNLNAALVPIYTSANWLNPSYGFTIDNNFNFLTGDYAEGSGLQGNGVKYLLTGMGGRLLVAGNRHLSAYEIANATTDYSPSLGSAESNAVQHAIGPWTSSTNYVYRTHNTIGGAAGNSTTKSVGFWVGSDTSSSSSILYRNGSSISSVSSLPQGDSSSNQYVIFGTINSTNALTEGSEARLGSYSIGLSLNSSEVLSFNNIMQAFQTTLGRNV